MGNSLRCCLACVLPFGALDVVRVVHLSGHVEEFSRPVTAGEILRANPNHILTKPCSQGVPHRILIVSAPESQLRRGSIYFLIPDSSPPQEKRKKRKKKKALGTTMPCRKITTAAVITTAPATTVEISDDGNNLTDLSEKKGGHRRRRSGPVAVWQPYLESISEDSKPPLSSNGLPGESGRKED